MKIGIDVMGGDFAPKESIAGAILASTELSDDDIIVLIGDEKQIFAELKEQNGNPNDFEIVHASEVIEMHEHPTRVFSKKPDSSIAVGFKLLKSNNIDSFSSSGNTGAMLVGSIYAINSVPGIIRPCTTAGVPKEDGGFNIILDVGTNPDTKPDVLYQFGILGSLYSKYVFGIKNPKVGLLNIGHEDEKGNLLCQSAFRLMKDSEDFNFVGNVESRDLFKDTADVVVCDGFTGNIVLKQSEAIYRLMMKRGLTDEFFDRFNYENYGGTPILGINSTVLIGHGISNAIAFKNMILLSKDVYKAQLSEKIKNAINKYNNKIND
ncbi:MAG: phosphate acyltransferase PlsX [Saprospiraceae bacterium]|nr:phosphate acyltransferase PlsX [Saprospiraceae bacterium]